MKEIIIPKEAYGQDLLPYLASIGVYISADCGGHGKCGKCRVYLLGGKLLQRSHPEKELVPDCEGMVLSCHAKCSPEGAFIGIREANDNRLTRRTSEKTDEEISDEGEWGIALDIGTTTIAMAGVNITTGEVFETITRLNPQKYFGADVMNRILACSKGYLRELHSLIIKTTQEMICELSEKRNATSPTRMTVVGNPTMLHVFANISPEGMGKFPFTPVFLKTKVYNMGDLGLNVGEIILLPSVSPFVGSDLTAGVLLTKMQETPDPTAIMDIGTNGEIVLCLGKKRGSQLFATSTAAGPALEGAGISCGTGGIDGAISAVLKTENGFFVNTIGDKSPIGLCGSGLIDAIAYLLDCSVIDETGYMEDDEFVLVSTSSEDISLHQSDIRAFQLAKSALRAGLETLVVESGLQIKDLSTLYLAGGLGFYLRKESAVRVGLLPLDLESKIEAVGNSALGGAIEVLLHPELLTKVEEIASTTNTVALQNSTIFNREYMEHMMFPTN